MFGINRNFPAGGGGTGDATAEQWDIKNGKDAYIASGKVTGTGYFPAMIKFDGSTAGYSKTSVTTSGNKFSLTLSLVTVGLSGNVTRPLFVCDKAGDIADRRFHVFHLGDARTATDEHNRLAVLVWNTSNVLIGYFVSQQVISDEKRHTLFFSFDGDIGAAVFRLDGIVDNVSATNYVAPTAGTLENGATMQFNVAAYGATYYSQALGLLGYRDAYLTNWSDFMHPDGTPKNIESTLNTVWGAQPLFWNESGYMQDNKGSAGAMTANGTIVLAAASDWS